MKKSSSSSPTVKSVPASTSLPRRGSEETPMVSPEVVEAIEGIDQDKLREKIYRVLGPHGTVCRYWDLMRDLVGKVWEDELTDIVFQARFVKKERKHPTPEKGKIPVGTVEWLPMDILTGLMSYAMETDDAEFFARYTKSLAALAKVFPNGIDGPIKPDNKWKWAAARFIKKHWDKTGCWPKQQAVREYLEGIEDYHGKQSLTVRPLTMEEGRKGSFEHVDRSPGRPWK